MKKKVLLLALLVSGLGFVGCHKNDDDGSGPVHDYAEEQIDDMDDIEQFLKTHSYTVVNNPGHYDDQDVTFEEVEENSPNAIWNSPLLTYRMVKTYRNADRELDYKVYYLKLREGGGAANDKPFPTNTDQVLTAYTGKYLFHLTEDEDGNPIDSLKTYEFETNPYPQTNFDLQQVIRGWSEIFPQFRGGDGAQVDGSPTLYTDFGAGVMFIPSALAYYSQSQGQIPAYAPLIFTFKLFSVTRMDNDNDGIPNYLEDLDQDRYIYIIADEDGNSEMRPDDIDGDGAPNYLDLDDDGDMVLTKVEMLVDQTDPDGESYTWENMPDCSGNTTDPARTRLIYNSACTQAP